MTRLPTDMPHLALAPADGRMGGEDDPFLSTRIETLAPRRGPASLPLTAGLMAMIILAMTVAAAALFLGGILTGVMLSGPGGPLADLRDPPAMRPPPPVESAPRLPAHDQAPAPAPPVVVIEPPLDSPPVAALPEPEKVAPSPPAASAARPERAPQTPSEAEKIEENTQKDVSLDIEQAASAPSPVIPQAKPVPDSPTSAPPAQTTFAIQAGAFSNESNAAKRAAVLKEMGYQPTIKPVAMSSGSTLHVVYVGSYATPREAAADRRTLRTAGIETALTAAP